MSLAVASQPTNLSKYEPPVPAKQGTTTTGNGLTDLLVKNSKGEEFVFSGKNLLKGKIENINILGENHKVVRELDAEGEVGSERFNKVFIPQIAVVPAAWFSAIAVNSIKAPVSPGVKFAVVAGASLAAGIGMSKMYSKDTNNGTNAVDNSADKDVKIEYAPETKGEKNLKAGLNIGFGAFVGASFGFFSGIPLAATEAFGFGATIGTVATVGAIAGGTLAYLSSQSK